MPLLPGADLTVWLKRKPTLTHCEMMTAMELSPFRMNFQQGFSVQLLVTDQREF